MRSTKERQTAENWSVAHITIEIVASNNRRARSFYIFCVWTLAVIAVTIWAGASNFKLAQPARAGSRLGRDSPFFFACRLRNRGDESGPWFQTLMILGYDCL